MTKTVASSDRSPSSSAIGAHAAMIAPSGTIPKLTNRQTEISSLRANAMMAIRRAPLKLSDALTEPLRQDAIGLIAQPQPGKLNHGLAGAAVARAVDPSVPIHSPALEGRWRQAKISCDLAPVAE